MRRLPSALLVLGLVPALMVAPALTKPGADPHPVDPQVRSVDLSGVDPTALRTLEGAATAASPDQAHEGRTVVLTAPRSTRAFDALGVTWKPAPRGTLLHVEVRTRADGSWTGWTEVPAEPNEAPDAGSADMRGGDYRDGTAPYLPGPSDGVQVRVDVVAGSTPDDLRLDLVDPGESDADASLTQSAPSSSAYAATTKPAIITRKQWGANESLKNGFAGYTSTIKAAFVHHTVSSNSYTKAQSAGMVRAIYAYHTNTRGYSDVAYNFIIDKYGQIFEGRAGGVAKAVLGAHTGGFNTNTFGVSALGNFEETSTPPAMVKAYERLLAWKLSLYKRNPTGKTTLTSSGGGTSKYAAGQTVTLSVISGHRDVGSTLCPGKSLYAKVDTIRTGTKALMAPAPSPTPTPTPTPAPTPTPTPTPTHTPTPASLPSQSTFVPLSPTKVLDTRSGLGTRAGPLSPARDRVAVTMPGRAGIPTSGVTGVAVTVRALKGTSKGKVVAFPTGRPSGAQTLDVRTDRWTSGHTSVGVGDRGRVTFRLGGKGSAHLVADVTGYYKTGRTPNTFHPSAPKRAYDSRNATAQALRPHESRLVSLNGRAGVPASARAVVVNVVAFRTGAKGSLAVYPARPRVPDMGALYFQKGQDVRRTLTVGLNSHGNLRLENRSNARTHVLLVVSGSWSPTAEKDGDDFVALTPQRVADTRKGQNVPVGAVAARKTVTVKVAGTAGVPAASTVTRVALSVTAFRPTARTYVDVDPWRRWGLPASLASQGGTDTNQVVVPVADDGTVTLRNSDGRTHLAVDVVGYFRD